MVEKATSGIVGAKVTQKTTDPEFKLGQTCLGDNGAEYVYVQANGAIAQYDAVGIDEDFQAAKLTKAMADDGWGIAAAQIAAVDNEYLWVLSRGVGRINVLAACVADVSLYTSGTAGSLDDDNTSQTKIDGVVITTTVVGAGSSPCILTYPRASTF